MTARRKKWTNPSVLRFAADADPIETVRARARELVAEAMDAGWSGPPFDMFRLADHLKLEVVPQSGIRDARTVPLNGSRLRIEFNPNRPRGRIKYSVAHEIAHTLFPDCADRVRNREGHSNLSAEDWQLEALCNVAAAEFVMPLGSMPAITCDVLDVDRLMDLRKDFEVSTEALFVRATELTDESCAMFCASRLEAGRSKGRYRIEYAIPSSTWESLTLDRGLLLPTGSVVEECTAIGFTARRQESWIGDQVEIESVGIPPFPGASHPRVVGLCKPDQRAAARPSVVYLKGDASAPRGDGPKIIVHVVNDRTPNWGGSGFAQALKRKWPTSQQEFRAWAQHERRALSLGNSRLVEVEDGLWVASIIAQKGYGPSDSPRIRYGALRAGLLTVATAASDAGASVHMPRIGCGQAGGRWEVVQELIHSTLATKRIDVTVYDPPGRELPAQSQQVLDFSGL